MKICKYLIEDTGVVRLKVPTNARLLTVGKDTRSDNGAIWLEVDPNEGITTIELHVVGTGESVPDGGTYIGSWFQYDMGLVWHTYVTDAWETLIHKTT